MKTPVQQAIDKVQSLKEIDAVINPIDVITTILSRMLEKEKEVMAEVYADGGDYDEVPQPRFNNYYNATFNNEER